MAASGRVNRPRSRQMTMNCAQAAQIASAVVAAEVGDGFVIGRQASGQPHQLDVALALPLKPAAGLDAVEVAVDVQLQQHRRMITWPSRRRGDHRKAKPIQIQRIDEGLDHSHRIIGIDIILQRRRQKRSLSTIRAFDEAMHDDLRSGGPTLP